MLLYYDQIHYQLVGYYNHDMNMIQTVFLTKNDTSSDLIPLPNRIIKKYYMDMNKFKKK